MQLHAVNLSSLSSDDQGPKRGGDVSAEVTESEASEACKGGGVQVGFSAEEAAGVVMRLVTGSRGYGIVIRKEGRGDVEGRKKGRNGGKW